MKNSCLIVLGVIACAAVGLSAFFFIKENRQRTMFDFTDTIMQIDSGKIEARLYGTWQYVSEQPQISHRKSPYELSIFFTASSADTQKVKMTLLEITCDGKSYSAEPISKSYEKETLISTVGGKRIYVLRSPKLTLPHEKVTVRVRLEIDGAPPIEELKFELLPERTEEKSNDIFDGIMSV